MVTVVPYDPDWAVRYEELREEYTVALQAAGVSVRCIEHVGSTAVPGQAAKPVVDIDIVVASQDVAAASAVLEGLGFIALGELGIPERWAFGQPKRLGETHTYVVVDGSLALRNHLAVRDALRADARLRDEYSAAKWAAAATAANIDEYGRGKNATVQAILQAAGISEADRDSIAANQVPPRRSSH